MKRTIFNISLIGALALFAAWTVPAQDSAKRSGQKSGQSSSAAATAAKVPVIVVGSAAKLTWATTKFTTKHLAKPVAKAAIVKAAPAATKFILKNGAKYLLPIAVKLSIL